MQTLFVGIGIIFFQKTINTIKIYHMEKSKIIYSISTDDIYEVASESLERKPTRAEIKYIEEKIGDHIDWFGIFRWKAAE